MFISASVPHFVHARQEPDLSVTGNLRGEREDFTCIDGSPD